MKLTAKADICIQSPRETVFRYLTDGESYPKFLLPLFPLAGIDSAELQSADEPAAGVLRTVRLTDGTVIEETIDEHEFPSLHAYSWGSGLKPPLSLIVNNAAARWTFEDTEGGTQVNWSYEFTLTSQLTWLVAKPVFLRFQVWMRRGLERAGSILEASGTTAQPQQ